MKKFCRFGILVYLCTAIRKRGVKRDTLENELGA